MITKNSPLKSSFIIAFLLLFTLKMLLVGDESIVSRLAIPGLLCGSVAAIMLFYQGKMRKPPFSAPLIMLFIVFLAGTINGSIFLRDPSDSIQAFLKIITMSFVFLGAYLATLSGWGKAIEDCIIFVVLCHVSLGIVLTFAGVGHEIGGVLRPTGITGRPQLLANIATFGALYALIFLFLIKGRYTVAYVTVLLICFAFIIMSATLKNAGTLLALMACVLFAKFAKKSLLTAILIASGSLLIACAVIIGTDLGSRAIEAFEGGLRLEVARGEELESSLIWRILHWRLLMEDWYANYFWLGSGLGRVTDMRGLTTSHGGGFAAHSDWVGFFVELGPLLFAALVVGVVWLWLAMGAHYPRHRGYAFIARLFLALFLIMAIAGNVFYSAAFQYLFWLLLGQIAAYRVCCR